MSDRTPRERLERKAERGFQGYPIGTIAFYGPDNRRASKVAVGIAHDDRGKVREWRSGSLKLSTCATTSRSERRSSTSFSTTKFGASWWARRSSVARTKKASTTRSGAPVRSVRIGRVASARSNYRQPRGCGRRARRTAPANVRRSRRAVCGSLPRSRYEIRSQFNLMRSSGLPNRALDGTGVSESQSEELTGRGVHAQHHYP